MGYCTLKDIISVIPERELINLTVDEPDENSVIDESIFDECTEVADSLINGYLRARYKLPLTVVPSFLRTIAIDITAYRLYMRRPRAIPEHIKDNYKDAISKLNDLKKGNIMLETPEEMPDGQMPAGKSAFRVNKTAKDRIFNDGLMNRFRGSI